MTMRPTVRKPEFLRLFLASALILVAGGLAMPGTANGLVSTLYAVTGSGGQCQGTLSTLYTLNPTTGAATSVANVTIGGNQVRSVTGLAVHPSTGVLYGHMNGQLADCSDVSDGTLITINKTTGVAAVVGSAGATALRSPDMAFDPFGTLYAWGQGTGCDDDFSNCTNVDDIYTLNITTGASTLVGECGCTLDRIGLAVDQSGRMYVSRGVADALFRGNPFTGELFSELALDSQIDNPLDFGPSGVLYTGERSSGSGFQLKTINPSTGAVTNIGVPNGVNNLSAIAWDLGTITPPAQSDLSLDKSVDNPSPSNWGETVVFTISVGVDTGSNATGVKVKDLLPSGFTYVSDNSGGNYNSSTGIWDVGTVQFGVPQSIAITTTVEPGGVYENTAEVVDSTTYDSDSVPGSSEGDTFDSVTVTPAANAAVDATVDVVVSGSAKANATRKSFSVLINNVGSQDFTVTDADLTVDLNGDPGAASCKPFSATIKPNRSVRKSCSANLASLGITPGTPVDYGAELDVPGDGSTHNDADRTFRVAS